MESLMEMSNRHMVIKRNVGNGWELVRSKLPALVTVVDTANTPRPAAAKLVMKYKKARGPAEVTREIAGEKDPASDPALKAQIDQKVKDLRTKGLLIEQWNLDDIKADLKWCGRDGSPTKVHRIQAVVLKGTGHKQFAANDTGVRELIHNLVEERTLG
jgi:electron transfer flavoprotein beta subunit